MGIPLASRQPGGRGKFEKPPVLQHQSIRSQMRVGKSRKPADPRGETQWPSSTAGQGRTGAMPMRRHRTPRAGGSGRPDPRALGGGAQFVEPIVADDPAVGVQQAQPGGRDFCRNAEIGSEIVAVIGQFDNRCRERARRSPDPCEPGHPVPTLDDHQQIMRLPSVVGAVRSEEGIGCPPPAVAPAREVHDGCITQARTPYDRRNFSWRRTYGVWFLRRQRRCFALASRNPSPAHL